MRIMVKSMKLEVKEYYNRDVIRVKTVDREQDLGIISDNSLSFEEHINSKVNKL